MTPKEAAEWMAAEARRARFLDHATVVAHLLATDESLITYNDSGNPAVAKPVLTAFSKLKAADIVWSMSGQHWRLREDGDPAGRRVP